MNRVACAMSHHTAMRELSVLYFLILRCDICLRRQPLSYRLQKARLYFKIFLHPFQKASVFYVCFIVAVTRTDSPLAKLYTTSTLEHHHFNHAVIILSTEVSDSVAISPNTPVSNRLTIIL